MGGDEGALEGGEDVDLGVGGALASDDDADPAVPCLLSVLSLRVTLLHSFV